MDEGVICVEGIAGIKDVHPLDTSKIPGCTYCMPQVASVGMTEAAAKAAGYQVKVGRFPGVGAMPMGDPTGAPALSPIRQVMRAPMRPPATFKRGGPVNDNSPSPLKILRKMVFVRRHG